ncbi:Metal Ion (Mn2 -iron) Transporter (Nramp) Family, partial [Phytophthora palmivora]
MRLNHIVLATAVALYASNDVFAAAESTRDLLASDIATKGATKKTISLVSDSGSESDSGATQVKQDDGGVTQVQYGDESDSDSGSASLASTKATKTTKGTKVVMTKAKAPLTKKKQPVTSDSGSSEDDSGSSDDDSGSSGDDSASTSLDSRKSTKTKKITKAMKKNKKSASASGSSGEDSGSSEDDSGSSGDDSELDDLLAESDSDASDLDDLLSSSGSDLFDMSGSGLDNLFSLSGSELDALLSSLGGSGLGDFSGSGLDALLLLSDSDSGSDSSSLDATKAPTKKKKAALVESASGSSASGSDLDDLLLSESASGSDELESESASDSESSDAAPKAPKKKKKIHVESTSGSSDDGSDLSDLLLSSSESDAESGSSDDFLAGLMSLSGSDLLSSSLNDALKDANSFMASTRKTKAPATSGDDSATSGMPKTRASELDLLLGDEVEDVANYDAVDKALALSVGEIQTPDEEPTTRGFSWRTLWAYAGPGWLMSIAYVDPGNLESDLQAGAYAGYQLTWVLFGATAMGLFLQVLAARLGVVTGKNLAEMCTAVYPRWASLTLWIMTEIAIVGSDVQEVLGSSIAFQVLFGFPLWVGCLITGFDTFTFLLLHRYGIRKLEAFFVSLIVVMLVCFCANLVRGEVASEDVLSGFVPRVDHYA